MNILNKLSFNEIIKIIIIFFILFLLTFITIFQYDSNKKKKFTIENHYKIYDIININLSVCESSKINSLEDKNVVNLEDFCQMSYKNKDFINLINIFINLFKNNEICNIYKTNSNNKCYPAVSNKNIENIINGETILSLVNNRLQIKTQISSTENITNIIILN